MSIASIRILVDELRSLQQKVSTATRNQQPDWRHQVVDARRDIAAKVGELSNATRKWTPPAHATDLYAKLGESVNIVRRSLAMHQALWPAIKIDTSLPEFQASVGELRGAYDQLIAHLDGLEQAVANGR